ncbi:hypothetical protein [Litoreibacter arenae]|uniref:Uncharacterized protein n=1 Tax=Litoreibacter arenae DSM 19593 TaxID=1123360 RepID=S9QJ34_9RHOB|nr:hypothetical protein [Litoreibacter arenae]EPX79827.1 hypothetical protein thalar_01163 [Litoreibacter arenae DSM 19593]
MNASCDETLTLQETASHGPLTIELWIARELCLQPLPQTTMLSDAPLQVRVKNTGPTPVQLVAAVPDAVFVTRVWDADRPAAPLDMSEGPPPESVPTTTVDIASGEAWETAPLSGYLNFLSPDLLEGTYMGDGTALDPALKLRRVVGLEVRFAASVNSGTGFAPVVQTLKGSIEAVVLPMKQDAQ